MVTVFSYRSNEGVIFFLPRLEETPTSSLRPAGRFPLRLAKNSLCPERVLAKDTGLEP